MKVGDAHGGAPTLFESYHELYTRPRYLRVLGSSAWAIGWDAYGKGRGPLACLAMRLLRQSLGACVDAIWLRKALSRPTLQALWRPTAVFAACARSSPKGCIQKVVLAVRSIVLTVNGRWRANRDRCRSMST